MSHSSWKIDNDTGNIMSGGVGARNAFGSFIIKKDDIQTWKLKITDCGGFVVIGIAEYKPNQESFYEELSTDLREHGVANINGYGWYSYNGYANAIINGKTMS